VSALVVVAAGGVATAATHSDPDDTPSALDIRRADDQNLGDRLALQVTTYAPFASSQASFVWSLDTIGLDGIPELFVIVGYDNLGLYGELRRAVTGDLLADLTVTRPAADALHVDVPMAALGGLGAYAYRLFALVDTNGNGEIDAGEEDTVVNDVVLRVAGDDRFVTAVKASQVWYGPGQAQAVVLARADNFPDALAGMPLAHGLDAPLLLTGTASLNAATEAEIKRALPRGRNVYVLGLTGSISDTVDQRLVALGYRPVRVGGQTRFETSALIAQQIPDPSVILLTTGLDFPDALVAGTAAAVHGGVVLLTAGPVIPPAVQSYLDAHPSVPRFAVGGPAAAAAPTAVALAGIDRYATARLVAEAFFVGPDGVGIATGLNFPDALAGGVLAAAFGIPQLLTDTNTLSTSVSDYLTANAATMQSAIIFGGPASVSDAVRAALVPLV
jgi:hypothetical protein